MINNVKCKIVKCLFNYTETLKCDSKRSHPSTQNGKGEKCKRNTTESTHTNEKVKTAANVKPEFHELNAQAHTKKNNNSVKFN